VFRLLAIIGIVVGQVPAPAQVSTTALDASPIIWDDQIVRVKGEIVGDYGRRPAVVWVQVNDGPYIDDPLVETGTLHGSNTGVGVRIPNDLFDDSWGAPGGYRTRGPVIEVTGVFRYADDETGGDTFIDAHDIQLIEPSRPLAVPAPDWQLVGVSLVAIAGGVALWGRARWRRVHWET